MRSSCSLASLSPVFAFFSRFTTRFSSESRSASINSGLDGVDIGERIDLAFDMGDIAILEAAYNVGDGVALPNIAKELVAQTLTLGCSPHQTGRYPRMSAASG